MVLPILAVTPPWNRSQTTIPMIMAINSLTAMGSGGNQNIGNHTFWVDTYPWREHTLPSFSHPTYIGTVTDGSIESVKFNLDGTNQ